MGYSLPIEWDHLDEEKTLGYEPVKNSGDYQQRDTVSVWKTEVVCRTLTAAGPGYAERLLHYGVVVVLDSAEHAGKQAVVEEVGQ